MAREAGALEEHEGPIGLSYPQWQACGTGHSRNDMRVDGRGSATRVAPPKQRRKDDGMASGEYKRFGRVRGRRGVGDKTEGMRCVSIQTEGRLGRTLAED